MSSLDGKVIRAVDVSSQTFRRTFGAIKDTRLQSQIRETIRSLLMLDIDSAPSKLHLHQLQKVSVQSAVDPKKKVSVWTVHVTPDDRYKASFTLQDCKAYFRLVDEHDIIDKRP